MNRDETRLREIKEHKIFYHHRLREAETILEKDLLNAKLNELTEEESQILKRCNTI